MVYGLSIGEVLVVAAVAVVIGLIVGIKLGRKMPKE